MSNKKLAERQKEIDEELKKETLIFDSVFGDFVRGDEYILLGTTVKVSDIVQPKIRYSSYYEATVPSGVFDGYVCVMWMDNEQHIQVFKVFPEYRHLLT